ncbi:MAG: UDP-N-acetylmuramyl-tripeptide synthetase [Patescibacteria group bacterium]
MDNLRRALKNFIPKSLFRLLQPYYHFGLALFGAVIYHFPSKQLVVIGVTGTKGKSTTTEILGHLLRAHGARVATLSTIQFTIGDKTERNLHKMTMPGRFFVQKFLHTAVLAGCTHAVIEMTSEGVAQHRHRFIDLDALVFTNLSPEHIESHGSFEKYKQMKLSLAKAVEKSPKRPRYLVANIDDEHGQDFLNFNVEKILPYSLKDLTLYTLQKDSSSLVIGDTTIRVPLIGLFNVYNTLAALTLVRALGMSLESIRDALRQLPTIAGRVEKFASPNGVYKRVTAVVDYAHTPDSLEKLYQAFPDKPKICVLGNTGGGRDTWKRPEMAAIAEKYCTHIILTNEDPYDEDPLKIVADMAKGIHNESRLTIELDRTTAIEKAIALAEDDSYVLITGKGTDPYIMGPRGEKTPWSDADTVKKILADLSTTASAPAPQ